MSKVRCAQRIERAELGDRPRPSLGGVARRPGWRVHPLRQRRSPRSARFRSGEMRVGHRQCLPPILNGPPCRLSRLKSAVHSSCELNADALFGDDAASPIDSTAATIRPPRPSSLSARATMRVFGQVGDAGGSPRQFALVALGVKCAGRDEGGRRRAAYAGVAMDHHRRGAVPVAHEAQQLADVVLAGVIWPSIGETISASQPTDGCRRRCSRAVHIGLVAEQRDDARAVCPTVSDLQCEEQT